MEITDAAVIELAKLSYPAINKIIKQADSVKNRLPSKSQLNNFKNYIKNRNIEEIKDFLNEREKVASSKDWYSKIFLGNNSLKTLLVKQIIDPISNESKLIKHTLLWEKELYGFFYHKKESGLLKIDLEKNNRRELLCRTILIKIVDYLILIKNNISLESLGYQD